MEGEYAIECPICDNKTVVQVFYTEDAPVHCPMCGEDIEAEYLDEE